MVLQIGMQEQDYVESTRLYKGKRVEIEGLKGNLFVFLKEDVEEISVAVVGPRTLVEQVAIEEQGDSLLVVQSAIDALFPDRPVIAITPEGSVFTKAVVTINMPLGTFVVLDDVKGFVRIKYGETDVLSFSN
jgi:hypothetical protein